MSIYVKDPQEQAQACVIWMHGLGADASDMMGLVEQLPLNQPALRHVFIDAPQRPVTLNGGMVMRAWYDIYGLKLVDRTDIQGITHSETLIREVLDQQVEQGLPYSQIYLAGFSQGGAMALHTGLNTPERLGGIIALSAYLPLGQQTQAKLDKSTPIFMAGGLFDPLVLPVWTEQTKNWIASLGYPCSFHQYPMEHAICLDEIKDIAMWLTKQREGA